MGNTSSRKLFLFGRYSLALLLPKKWLSLLNIKRGDSVQLKLERSKRRIIVTLLEPVNTAADSETKVYPKNNKNPKPSVKPEDWEPIPQL